MKIENRKFEVRMTCFQCGESLNKTKAMDYKKIQNEWTGIVMSSGFNSGRCPKCKSSTFSDLNIHTKLKIYDVKTNKEVNYQLFKFLSGRFYSDDYDKICFCDKKPLNEIYESKKYPEVHGKCGRWIKKYKDSPAKPNNQE